MRKAALERTNALTNEQKIKWREVLIGSFISSEESGEENINGTTQQCLYIKALPWRDSKVTKFMKAMDEKCKKKQSVRAKRQMLPRVPGGISSRSKPIELSPDFWGFAD